MTVWFRRWAVSASLILIAGCADAQLTPAGAVTDAAGTRSSLMRPQTKVGDLLYYSGAGQYGNETYMLSFPKGELIGSFAGDGALCPDNAGNVWLAGYPNKFVSKELAEFAHGGETPMRTLDVPSVPNDCAVDPVTGNIAVVSAPGKVYIYGSTSSAPRTFTTNFGAGSCTYDSSGNLFILGNRPKGYGARAEVAELPEGAKKFERRWGYRNDTGNFSGVRWDGTNITIGTGLFMTPGVTRFSVRGKHLQAQGGLGFRGMASIGAYSIQGSKIVLTNNGGIGKFALIYMYPYPAGGRPVKKIGQKVVPGLVETSVAISLAPHH